MCARNFDWLRTSVWQFWYECLTCSHVFFFIELIYMFIRFENLNQELEGHFWDTCWGGLHSLDNSPIHPCWTCCMQHRTYHAHDWYVHHLLDWTWPVPALGQTVSGQFLIFSCACMHLSRIKFWTNFTVQKYLQLFLFIVLDLNTDAGNQTPYTKLLWRAVFCKQVVCMHPYVTICLSVEQQFNTEN